MNRLEKNFSLRSEAVLKYVSGEYKIVTPGDFVRCAVTGVPIPLDELRYWSYELQEPYASAEIAFERHRHILAQQASTGSD
jgi:hypothetical protein